MKTNVIIKPFIKWLILFSGLLIYGCTSNTSSTTENDKVDQKFGPDHWLIGSWQYYAGKDTISEVWTWSEKELAGVNTKLKGRDTLPNELISLRLGKENYVYEVKVRDQNNGEGVPFKLKHYDDSEFVFENLKHDFPQKITYRLLPNDTCIASISGNINDQERKVDFKLFRVEPL